MLIAISRSASAWLVVTPSHIVWRTSSGGRACCSVALTASPPPPAGEALALSALASESVPREFPRALFRLHDGRPQWLALATSRVECDVLDAVYAALRPRRAPASRPAPPDMELQWYV